MIRLSSPMQVEGNVAIIGCVFETMQEKSELQILKDYIDAKVDYEIWSHESDENFSPDEKPLRVAEQAIDDLIKAKDSD